MGIPRELADDFVTSLLADGELRVVEGEVGQRSAPSDYGIILVQGTLCRCRVLQNGRQNITSLLLPGDSCRLLGGAESLHPDEFIRAMGPAQIVAIPRQAVDEILEATSSRELSTDLLLQELAISKEWLTNVARREAYERIAHLYCEIYVRLSATEQVKDQAFTLPLTQSDLADILGLSNVHFNKMLRLLREQGYLSVENRVAKVYSIMRLMSVAGFDPTYLRYRDLPSFMDSIAQRQSGNAV